MRIKTLISGNLLTAHQATKLLIITFVSFTALTLLVASPSRAIAASPQFSVQTNGALFTYPSNQPSYQIGSWGEYISDDASVYATTAFPPGPYPGSDPNTSSDYPNEAYIVDRATGIPKLVAYTPDGRSFWDLGFNTDAVGISRDGRYVLFEASTGPQTGPYSDPTGADVPLLGGYVYDTQTHQSVRVTQPYSNAGFNEYTTSISGNGRYVIYSLIDYSGQHSFLHDVVTGLEETIGVGNNSIAGGAISSDGRYVAYVQGTGVGQAYVLDRQTGSTTEIDNNIQTFGGMSISDDGNIVAYQSSVNGTATVKVFNRTTGVVTNKSLGTVSPVISGDGSSLVTIELQSASNGHQQSVKFSSPVDGPEVDLPTADGIAATSINSNGSIFGSSSYNSSTRASWTNTVFVSHSTPIPSAPTNLTIPSPTQNPALTWTASTAADTYNIYRDGTLLAFSSTASYTDTSAPQGSHSYRVTAVNSGGESGQSNTISVYVNHTAPVTSANLSPNQYAQDNTYPDPVTITLAATPATGVNIVNTFYALDGGAQLAYSSPFTVTGSGSHTITYWSVDNSGLQEAANTKTFTIHINLAPSVSSFSGTTLNEGSTYSASGSFSDWDSSSWTATVDYGDGSGAQPLTLSGNNFSLSLIYKDEGTYTVKVSVTDNQGATGTTSATVIVTNAPFTISTITAPTSPVQVNNSVSASANFSDPGVLDTHTAVWNWGDGSTSTGTVTENNGSGSVSDSHTYTTTGVYTITLTATDDDNVSNTQTFMYVSVYNPTPQGLFSGARIFTSPAGADPVHPSATGQVQFGISVKYNHSNQPTGNVSMNFGSDNLDFVANSITVLVTSNGMATVRGTGTINGSGSYTFLATGVDSQSNNGTGLIRFQIKDSSDNVVYDTQPSAADTATPTATVTGHVNVH